MNALIVGAGPGGLATAINLAGLGVKVSVIEKEPVPGGRMRGMSFDGYDVDTGPTIMQLPEVIEAIVARSGKRLSDYVTLKRLDPNTRIHFWDGSVLDTSSDVGRMHASLAKLNPKHPAAFDRWLAEANEKYGVAYEKFIATHADSLAYFAPWRLIDTLKFKPWQTLYKHLDSYFHDDRVTYALSYPSKYLGLHPTTCSSVFSVIPYIEMQFGVWHVMGGFRSLSRGLQKCAEDLGATFRFNAPVAEVLADSTKVTGVRLASGETLTADLVIINADLPYAATKLIRPELREGTRLSDDALEKARYSCSTFMMYLGLDRRYDELPHHLISLSNAARKTDKASLEDLHLDLDDPPFYVCNPTPTDRAGAPDGHSTLYVLVPTPNTSHHSDWEGAKRELEARIPTWLEKLGFKDVKKHIRSTRTISAQGWRDDFNVFRGAVFNLSHNWTQLGPLRPKVKSPHLENLYWVGGGTHPGSGLLTIMESANIAGDYVAKLMGLPSLPQWPYVPPVTAQRGLLETSAA
jgi:phytoene desaturase